MVKVILNIIKKNSMDWSFSMYSFDSRVRYSEVDHNKKLDLSSIINYFQDCSTFHSEDVGQSISYLEKVNRVWILNSWQIIIHRFPSLGETITTGTWAYDFKSMYGYRNFIMKDSSDNILATANSIWVFMDTVAMRPVRITENDIECYIIEQPLEMEYAPRKIKLPNEFCLESDGNNNGLPSLDPFPVVKSNIDTNNHVNNGQYIKMAEEYLPVNFQIKQMRAEYRMSAILGDIIVPKVHCTGNICTVVLSNTENKPYAIIEFTGKDHETISKNE